MTLERIKHLPLIGILRGIREEHIPQLTDCIVAAGLESVEITMNTDNAGDLIRAMISHAGNDLVIGAGTVLKIPELHDALDAGAKFVVSPVISEDVIEYCYMNNIPVFPGALSPTEIYRAWQAGATMVKVFPASLFGPGYFKEIKAPLNKTELMAVGGVSKDNLARYFEMGASAVAFGGSIFKHEWMNNDEFSKISTAVSELIGIYRNWKKQASDKNHQKNK